MSPLFVEHATSNYIVWHRFVKNIPTATLVSVSVLSGIDYCSSLLSGFTRDVTFCLQWMQNYAAGVILLIPMSSSITTYFISLAFCQG